MKRNASISVQSHQYLDGDINRISTSCEGVAEFVSENVIIRYNEDLGEGIPTECSIEVRPDSVCIQRNGHVRSSMLIIEGKKHESVYRTIYGDFDMTVTGKKLKIKKTENKIEITAYYYLDLSSSGDILNKVVITAGYGDIINE